MKRRKRRTARPLDDWPEATHPADYLGAEQYDEAVVLRWQAPGGRLALVWPFAEGITTVEHYARLLPDADAVALVRLDFGVRGPAVDAISRGTGPYAMDYPTLAALIGMPVPYWPATLRIPDVIRTWHPGDPCVSRPARCELESAPLLQLAAAFPDNSPPHRVLIDLVQVAQADSTASARQDLEQAAGAPTDPLGSDVLTVAALPTSVPAADRDDLDPTTRHAGWLEILRRDDPPALASIRQVMRWNGGRDLPFGHVVTIEEPDVGPAAEWAGRLQPCPRTAAAALVDPKGLDEILTDPATDAPVARDIRGRLHTASPRRLPTTSPLAEVILDRQIWIRVADGSLYPAPQHHYFGIGWGYNGSGPATLALTIHRLLDDITALAGDSTTGAPRGLLTLVRHPWPKGMVLTRSQLEASRITDRISEEMNEWLSRPLEAVYAAIFIDAIVVKVRDGQVANRPFYAAIGVTVDGRKDVLGLWAGTPGDGEGARYWLAVLTELKNRGVTDTMFVVCDGLKGLPEVVETTWPDATVQTCVIHLLRNSFRLTSRKYWDQIARELKLVYTASSATTARAQFEEFTTAWGDRYPALIRLWDNAWEEFTPFLDYDVEIRRILFSTNAIESLNARYRRAVRARGHFPNEQAALKCLYLVTRSLDPSGRGQARWTMRWKPALNVFATVFEGRWPTAEKY